MPPPKKFAVREALQNCSPMSFRMVKFSDNTFVQVLNRGFSFHGQLLRARNWVVSYTLKEL